MTSRFSDLLLMFLFILLADKEGSGDEEEATNGNVIFQIANTCSEPLRCITSSCHLSSKIEFRICSSSNFLPTLRGSAVTNKVFLSQKPGTKKFFNYVLPQKWNSLFPPFLRLNLCMSLWFRCSGTAVQRQSSTKRWNKKAVWGDIEAQANSTPGWSAEHKCFSSFLNFSSVSRCCRKWRRGDGQSDPRYEHRCGRGRIAH